jgi:ABC-type sugar transport system ATPase subunit
MGRKAQELADLQMDIAEARTSRIQADTAKVRLEEQRGWVESIVSVVAERRQRNGFGGEFSISTTPRKKA